jgi:thiamine-phosphate pyrophosphorylase
MASTFGEHDGVRAGGRRAPASLYFITMDDAPTDHLQQVESACRAGIRWIQLRMKQASDEEVRDIALAAKGICAAFDCTLIIDDRVAIAAAVDADGVHLGKEDMTVSEARRLLGEDKIIGGTANVAEDIEEHYRQGADYIGLGPYRYTTTKKKLSPILGLEGYRQIMNRLRQERIDIPVIAIGGIGVEDVALLLDTGLAGVAFSGMLVHADDPKGLVEALEGEVSRAEAARG